MPHTFKDIEGDEWTITLTTGLLREIRSGLNVDLLSFDEKCLTKLINDNEALVDLLSWSLTDQINKRGLDEMGFAKRLVGDTLDDACEALVEELLFTCRRSQRAVLRAAWEKVTTAQEKVTQKAIELINSPMVDQQIDKALEKAAEQLGRS